MGMVGVSQIVILVELTIKTRYLNKLVSESKSVRDMSRADARRNNDGSIVSNIAQNNDSPNS